jgi:hypothetical protein
MSMTKGKPEYVRVAISRPDGSLAIMQFVTLVKRNPEDPGFVREPTSENITAEIAKAGFGAAPWRIIDDTDIPQDRTHRDAWKMENDKIVIDPTKAAAIDEKRMLDEAVEAAIKAQHDALVESVKASLK